ncbi:MAG: YkoF family thiamine/hydroxymethylpyrimidine-binding protein [Flavobacteriaceae bacterium]|nr:YkoF family thiamine/hydroxymethylpyrimidine-binding protein [Flavobacteriaceae bacterium]
MKISVDISMYPLHRDFEIPIKNFIKKLRSSGFTTIENPLSTQVYGDYSEVMDWLQTNIKEAFLNENNCVFTLKIIKGDRSSYEPSF